MWVIDNVAALLPLVAVGVNVTVNTQFAPGETALEQPVTEKSTASVPVIDKLDIVSGPVPLLVMVKLPVVVLLGDVLKLNEFEEILNTGTAASAVLLKLTVLGLPVALCIIDSVAVLLPVVLGAKVTVNVHVPPAATELAQPLTVKSDAFAPEIANSETVSGAVPVFVTVIVPVFV